MNKTCADCKNELSIEMFGVHRREKDGYDCYCKNCKRSRHKRYWNNNKNKLNEKQREYYGNNSDKVKERNNDYIKNNREKHNVWGKKSRVKLKAEVFSHYSNGTPKCSCGEDDLGLLTIDHINGGGNEHRLAIGVQTGYSFYQWLKKNGFPKGFQVLCWNCQFKKKNIECKPKNPTHLQEVRARYVQSIKLECLSHYGSICECGESDQVVLSLDHVNDDGAKHRAETGTRGFNFYMMLRKNKFPSNPPLKVLCLNCQYRKRNKLYERECRSAVDCEDAA